MIKRFWLKAGPLFDFAQILLNGNFWGEFVKRFGLFTGKHIVDLACGTGELTRHINPKKYLGIDINKDFIEQAKHTHYRTKTKFILGDITTLRISSEWDTILFISAAHHLSDEQIQSLCLSLRKNRVKNIIIVDGYPVGIFAGPLSFLDSYLGGGKYFRKIDQMKKVFGKYIRIHESGEFSASLSFYRYPYLVATAIRP